jgi:hypothetical protein
MKAEPVAKTGEYFGGGFISVSKSVLPDYIIKNHSVHGIVHD